MQDKDTTNMLDVLAESLVAYGRTIRRTWYGVLAVFVIMELLRHGVRAATAHSGILCGKGLPLDNLVGIMLSLTVGLIASALVVRTTLCCSMVMRPAQSLMQQVASGMAGDAFSLRCACFAWLGLRLSSRSPQDLSGASFSCARHWRKSAAWPVGLFLGWELR